MKKLFLLLLLLLSSIASAHSIATAIYLFTLKDPGTTAVDVEVYNKTTNTLVSKTNNVAYLNATPRIQVPTDAVLKITFYKAGTTLEVYSADDVAYLEHNLYIEHLYGTPANKRFSSTTAAFNSPFNKIEYSFLHSSNILGEIDFTVTSPFTSLADDFEIAEKTSSISTFDAADVTLGIAPFDNPGAPIYSYALNGAAMDGAYSYFYLVDNDLYWMSTLGVVTKLNLVMSVMDKQTVTNSVKTYPNPVQNNTININLENPEGSSVTIYNSQGTLVFSAQNISDLHNLVLPELNAGYYQVKISSNGNISTSAFTKL